jgi:hypothetical protein
MSFGFSPGDIIAVVGIVRRIRRDFIDAPTQFKGISQE